MLSGTDRSNIITRHLAVQGECCHGYDERRAGADAVHAGNGAHRVWLDHLDISDGQDGNCDFTQEADFITVSWTHFHYPYAKAPGGGPSRLFTCRGRVGGWRGSNASC